MATQDFQPKAYWLRYTNHEGKPVLSSALNPAHLEKRFHAEIKAGHTDVIGYFGNASERNEMFIQGGVK